MLVKALLSFSANLWATDLDLSVKSSSDAISSISPDRNASSEHR